MGIIQRLNKEIIKRTQEEEDQIIPYGILGVLGFSFFYIINGFLLPGSVKEEVCFRIIAAVFSLTLALKNYWPKCFKPLLPVYWHIALTFNIPFFFTFILLSKPEDHIWPIHWVLALTLLILLVDLISFLVLSCIGISLAIIFHIYSYQLFQLPTSFGALIAAYVSFTLYYIFIFKKRQLSHNRRISSLKMQAGAIAHEMRTPLSAIDAIAGGLKLHLPTLIHTYKMAQEKDQSIPRIHKNALQSLSEAPDELKVISRSAFTVVDMLLTNLKEDVPESTSEKCSISQCVETSLSEYSLRDSDKKLISVEIKDDFEFYGNSLMIKHVLFNLLKNALHYLKAANKGNITIWTETGSKVNKLYFEDTGKGIPKDYLPHIFDQFFTRTAFGSGVGLAFCKMVMTKLGGDITCESVEGDYTRFILTFPTLTEDKLP